MIKKACRQIKSTRQQIAEYLPALLVWSILCTLTFPNPVQADPIDKTTLFDLGKRFCGNFSNTPDSEVAQKIAETATELLAQAINTDQTDIEIRGRNIGQRLTLEISRAQVLEVQLISPPARPPQTVLTYFESLIRHDNNKPSAQLTLDAACRLTRAQQITYTDIDTPAFIQSLTTPDDHTLAVSSERSWINPEPPRLAPIDPPRLRVGMIDSGVNHRLQQIANALARDKKGNLIGYDYWDNDNIPYDANPARSPFFVQRHGTRTASIVIAEAPGVAIVPYRYPRPDMSRMRDLVEHAAANNVRIIGMPLGSNDYKSWTAFEQAAKEHPELLFIVSAGNNGRDIDIRGVYPAAMDLKNMLVVTSSNDFVQPAERTNYGRISVDYLLPAEEIEALDYTGQDIKVSGSSYAVSRVVALAARILNRNPQQTTTQLIAELRKYSVRANTAKYVTTGFLGDPLVSPAPIAISYNNDYTQAAIDTDYSLPLTINILEEKWSIEKIENALTELNNIFKQCSITATIDKWQIVHSPDYLKDLSTGHALTLHRKLPGKPLSVFFARDTKMQPQFDAEAFGAGNTSNRPWMRNTLWLTHGIEDTGIALAHELYHIIANDGSHVTTQNNLMHERTADSHRVLTKEQCKAAIDSGLDAGLIQQ